jgi:hypothetical protein
MSFEERTGPADSKTVGADGIQGAAMAGMQGIGVRTPSAAAVAAATVGFAGLVHMPNGTILTIGAKSIIEAMSGPQAKTGGPLGKTVRGVGAIPKLHLQSAPQTTTCGMSIIFYYVKTTCFILCFKERMVC